MKWQSSASMATLQKRAQFLQAIRDFFEERNVMEVEVPLLCQNTVTDVHLASFCIDNRYLQTSPEYGMKRLLAQGSGPIYYLGKAFRQGEIGQRHNPEFTMLEWYRPFWDHLQLIEEVDQLFQFLLGSLPAKTTTYAELFKVHFDICVHQCDIEALQKIALSKQWVDKSHLPMMDKDGWLDLLMSHGIEPYLGQLAPQVVLDFPASQASLAKTRVTASYEVSERFEFYYQGVELANGYNEQANTCVLRERFHTDCQKRKEKGLPFIAIDENLLAALEAGFPPCAGVALGVDRLFMLKLQEKQLANVLSFAWENA